MPVLRVAHEAQRKDQVRRSALALRRLRGQRDPFHRHRGARPGRLRRLAAFRESQVDMPGQGRTFRRRCARRFWAIWPMPEAADDQPARVVYVDGIWVASDCVVLIACSDEFVLSGTCARRDHRGVEVFLSRVAALEVGGDRRRQRFRGPPSRRSGPSTKVQRCVFHAFWPGQAADHDEAESAGGIELYGLVKELLHIETLAQAEWWARAPRAVVRLLGRFLEQRSVVDGRSVYTHERLRARGRAWCGSPTPAPCSRRPDPALAGRRAASGHEQRRIEGVNAQLDRCCASIGGHEAVAGQGGLLVVLPARRALRSMADTCAMPTDADIDMLRDRYASRPIPRKPEKWARGLFWEELHHAKRHRIPSTE